MYASKWPFWIKIKILYKSWTLLVFLELPHKAPTITTDVNIKEYEVKTIELCVLLCVSCFVNVQIGDLLELNCTSEPSHPASELSWEMNKIPVTQDNYIFNEKVHNGKKLFVTRIGLRIRLNRDHFHWGKLKVKIYL